MSVGVCYNKPHNDLFSQINPYKKENIQKVKRALFGPVDHEKTLRFVTKELEKHCQLQSERWNFDFKHEKPLTSEGVYDWKPATPIKNNKPVKRRPSTEIEFDNDDLYCFPANIVRPRAIKPTIDQENKTIRTSQMLITDYMQLKKNPSSGDSKKLAPRPSKMPRLGQLKS